MNALQRNHMKADVVFAKDNEPTYPTHWRASRTAVEAAQLARVSWDIRFFEPNIGTAARVGFVPDHYVDISDVFERKVEALKKLAAQPRLVPEYTLCNSWRALECGRQYKYAEAFVRWAPKPPVYDLLS